MKNGRDTGTWPKVEPWTAVATPGQPEEFSRVAEYHRMNGHVDVIQFGIAQVEHVVWEPLMPVSINVVASKRRLLARGIQPLHT